MVNGYFAKYPERRRDHGGVSGWVYEAAEATYPCAARHK